VTRPVRPGEPWGAAAAGPADVEVTGGDPELAAVVAAHAGARVRFVPTGASDFARAVGLGVPAAAPASELEIDALLVEGGPTAVNALVVGRPPDRTAWWTAAPVLTVTVDGRPWYEGRATGLVVANGQYLRGHDLAPRGHPGDGWAELQCYALGRSERGALRRRLRTGGHVPHPRIRQGRARVVEVVARRPLALEVDGVAAGRAERVRVVVAPAAIRLLV
jgi:hypothetical protein